MAGADRRSAAAVAGLEPRPLPGYAGAVARAPGTGSCPAPLWQEGTRASSRIPRSSSCLSVLSVQDVVSPENRSFAVVHQ